MWRDAKTKKRREELFHENGVCWSSLYCFVYCDNIRHTVLGVMHCWLEGVLQHHAQKRLGIGGILPSNLDDAKLDDQHNWTAYKPDAMDEDKDGNHDLEAELAGIFSKASQHEDDMTMADPIHPHLPGPYVPVGGSTDSSNATYELDPLLGNSSDEGSSSEPEKPDPKPSKARKKDTKDANSVFSKAETEMLCADLA
jgi:hypothetical protein